MTRDETVPHVVLDVSETYRERHYTRYRYDVSVCHDSLESSGVGPMIPPEALEAVEFPEVEK